MKILISIFLFVLTQSAYCQQEEIYRLTFSDPSNFWITTQLNHKLPEKIRVLDTTERWSTKRFWLNDVNLKSPKDLEKVMNDEHHPYNHTYLFKDNALDKLINDKEKISLSIKAAILTPSPLTLKGINCTMIHSAKNIRGFYFMATTPLFSSDKKYAFIDLSVFLKEKPVDYADESLFGSICIIYQKQPDHSWKRIKLLNHLIL